MHIGELALATGLSRDTLRFYEKRGLLRARRQANGYRDYPADAVRIVRFIKNAQELGFSLDEIEELVRLRGGRRGERQQVRAIAERKITDIDRKIAQLQSMRDALDQLAASCRDGAAAHCPIIDALNDAPRGDE